MNVAIVGYGKMGREIEKLLVERGHKVVLVVDINNHADLNTANLRNRNVDVAVEFSAPQAAYGNIVKCLEAGVPIVCGTTAWLERFVEIEQMCKKFDGTFFYASNYSIGVNITFRVNEVLARLMNRFPEYDVTIEETHHTQKKDAPSGTAITLAESVLENLDRKGKWVCATTTEPSELEIMAIRRSVVPGTHVVTYESPADIVELKHTAKSRAGFVEGAVLAAEFICGKKGVYTMRDILGF